MKYPLYHPGAPKKCPPPVLKLNYETLEQDEAFGFIPLLRGRLNLTFDILLFNFGPAVQKL